MEPTTNKIGNVAPISIEEAGRAALAEFQRENTIELTTTEVRIIRQHQTLINQLQSEFNGMLKMIVHQSYVSNKPEVKQASCNWALNEDCTALIPQPQMLPPPKS